MSRTLPFFSLTFLWSCGNTAGEFNLAGLQLMSKVPISDSKQCLEVMCVVNTMGSQEPD